MPTLFQNIQSQFSDGDSNARAIDLARRLTTKNEPDFLHLDNNVLIYLPTLITRFPFLSLPQQRVISFSYCHGKEEDMLYEENNEKTKYTHDYCKMIALTLHSRSDFPVECMKYEDAATIFHEKNEAYIGMSPGK
ncbi:hypothetical protein ACHAXS_006993 [Conticribra weissflogii]